MGMGPTATTTLSRTPRISRGATARLLLAAACLLPGCMQPMRTPFDESQFAPFAGEGTATITGQAFMKTRGGDVKFGAGNKVKLFPATDYTNEIRNRGFEGGENIGPFDPRLEAHVKSTLADASGNFEFKKLRPGTYHIACMITWEVPGGGGLTPTGGIAHATATVAEGETVKVVVTR